MWRVTPPGFCISFLRFYPIVPCSHPWIGRFFNGYWYKFVIMTNLVPQKVTFVCDEDSEKISNKMHSYLYCCCFFFKNKSAANYTKLTFELFNTYTLSYMRLFCHFGAATLAFGLWSRPSTGFSRMPKSQFILSRDKSIFFLHYCAPCIRRLSNFLHIML